ncbi:glycosyltransferase family 2 protein [Methylobacillus flagellatus]|uniref:glycosyltransferase family 2 protein n=1 Tax=Methylobacillus flagellatus TaxID=405 RepID=UPI002854138F|nr:glycosyltransferase family 2 protein [Methylobacillus flagellatus]MDR5171340.1 glycosyltransferase family 2 protein [Methylobacillus flagellatus]
MTTDRSQSNPHISVIVPAFNEAAAITSTVENIANQLAILSPHWDIVVIDDGSRDKTADIVRSLPAYLRTTLVRFSRNFGKEYAITAGLEYAGGDIVICMDADGQHSSALIGEMLEKWREGYDMVYAVRQDRHVESGFKRWGSKVFYEIMTLGERITIPRDAGDFRLMNRNVVDALRNLPERNRFMKGMYAWVGYKSIGIPYTPLPRSHGVSTFSRLKLMQLAWTGITSFSVIPLRLASAVGGLLALLAFIYGIWVILEKMFFHESIPGWPTVVASLMFFSGVQLLFIGILGEYIARIYDEVKGRPPYIVAEVSAAYQSEPPQP